MNTLQLGGRGGALGSGGLKVDAPVRSPRPPEGGSPRAYGSHASSPAAGGRGGRMAYALEKMRLLS